MKHPMIVVCLTIMLPFFARADEGMWTPQQIPALAERLRALGFQGDANARRRLQGGAIVAPDANTERPRLIRQTISLFPRGNARHLSLSVT